MSRAARRLRAVPVAAPSQAARIPHGGCALENADRATYQSARVQPGLPIPPLPLSEAQAWAEALRGRA